MNQQTTSLHNNNSDINPSEQIESEEILNAIPDLVFKVNLVGTVLWANQSFIELTSAVNVNPVDSFFLDIFKPCKGTVLTQIINDTVSHGQCNADAWITTIEGDKRYQLKCVLSGTTKDQVVIVARDIHERMKNVDLIVQSHTQLQKLIDAFPFLICLTTPSDNYILANKKYCKFFDITQNQIIDSTTTDIFDANISECLSRDNDKLLTDKSSIHYEGEIVLKSEKISLSVDKFPLFDENGNIYAICGVVEDITKQYQLQRQLQQSQKMEAIGQLTGGIAHDFNNVLASIMGYTGLMKRTVSKYDDPTTQGYISQINRAGGRARDLVQQLLAFSRGDVGGLQVLDPVELANESMNMLASVIPTSIKLNLHVENNISNRFIEVDPGQFSQSLMNLVINAKDAIPDEKGTIDVNLEYVTNVSGVCDSCHISYSGNYICLSISDSGEGISNDILQRIFDPFFTTKGVGEGSGMGLSMVHGIVHGSGGHIKVKSVKNKQKVNGTTIQVFFPEIITQNIQEKIIEYTSELAPPELENQFSGKTILVIDDEPLITSCLTEVLRFEGFEVISYNDSQAGLAHYKNNTNVIDLIITDQTMPEMTGMALARDILDGGYEVPVILCSGYSELKGDTSNEVTGIDMFLTKPYKDSLLLKNINSLLIQYDKKNQ